MVEVSSVDVLGVDHRRLVGLRTQKGLQGVRDLASAALL